ncbi:MAG: HAD family phosphatase [Alphaproteobacteria bacterium]|nr:MAG: HAD family phosphatase [Alphaproteobacteria bacterium]
MQPPRAVVFDIGNVLVGWDPERLYARLIPDAAQRQAFFAEAELAAMNRDIDLGAPFRARVEAQAAAHPRHAALIRAWHDRWSEMFRPAIAGSVALMRLLRARGVAVHALSNFGAETFALARSIYPVLGDFDLTVISGEEGVAKPDAEIYARLEARTGLERPALFFTDDRAENVAAARRRGWRTHLFRNPAALALELVEAGLIAPHELTG